MDIYENFTFFSKSAQMEEEEGRKGGGGVLNEELIDIQNLNYQNYMNSQIILAAVKWTNSKKQVRDGWRRSEERRIVLIDTDQT